jgi:hexulose-6-phosphate isomerase
MNRRDFLKRAATSALSAGVVGRLTGIGPTAAEAGSGPSEGQSPELKKAAILSKLPEMSSLEDRFKLARDSGFHGLEVPPVDLDQARKMREAAEKAGIELHSVMYGGWQTPLSSPDTQVAEKGAADIAKALESARELGADGVLLVPAVVNDKTRYVEAYERSQKHLRKLAPVAEKLKVRILVEDVWNNFLLSPLEFARYIDELKSPWVQAYFDVGNVVAFGWPEDWIRTLGKRIKKVHLKDFKRGPRQWTNLRDGDVNWPEVRKALHEVGYKGYLTAELPGGDEAYLRDLSARMDMIINEPV